MAGRLQGAAGAGQASQVAENESGAVFGEVLDALSITPPAVEIPEDSGSVQNSEHMDEDAEIDLTTDDADNVSLFGVDEIDGEFHSGAASVQRRTEVGMDTLETNEQNNIQLREDVTRGSDAFDFVASEETGDQDRGAPFVETLVDDISRSRYEEIASTKGDASSPPISSRAESDAPKGEFLKPVASHPTDDSAVAPAVNDVELMGESTVADGATGRNFNGAQTVENIGVTPKPEFTVSTAGTQSSWGKSDDIDLVRSATIYEATATTANLTERAAVPKVSDEMNAGFVGGTPRRDQHISLSAEVSATVSEDIEQSSDRFETKVAPSTLPQQSSITQTAAIAANQDVYKTDFGAMALGTKEHGYAELSKFENASIGAAGTSPTSLSMAQQAAQQMVRVAQAQPGGPVELALNPEELGRVKLTFTSHENTLVVSIVGERPETIDLMRRHIDSLNQEFKNIGYGDVSFSFSQSGGDGFQGENGNGGASQNADGAGGEVSDLEVTDDANVQEISSLTGLDIRI